MTDAQIVAATLATADRYRPLDRFVPGISAHIAAARLRRLVAGRAS